jgi:myo-inositol-1(or 4)-monophosphatase
MIPDGNSMTHDIEAVAMRAARAAGKVHLARLLKTSISYKANAIDLVTEADREAEAAVIGVIRRSFPDHAVLGEESGASAGRSDDRGNEHRWIIDPLDGTTNFAHGYPQFCVSIGYERRGRIEFGVVYDALKKECFTARRGHGACLNGEPIRVSKTPRLATALLGTGFPYDRRERRQFYLCFWESFMVRTQGVRRTGAAALDLCYVACGRCDGFWEFGLKAWDVAAGSLIVEEAGGRVTNMDGTRLDLDGRRVLATNRRLHRAMVNAIAEAFPEAERRQAALVASEA